MAKDGLDRIAITCKASELVSKLAALNPDKKKYMLVSQIIEEAYARQVESRGM